MPHSTMPLIVCILVALSPVVSLAAETPQPTRTEIESHTATSTSVQSSVPQVGTKDVERVLVEYPGTIIFSNLFGFIFGLALIVLAYRLGTHDGSSSINFLVCLLGATLGLALGILLSPYTSGEQAQFAAFLQAGTVFVSGYLLSKLDPLIERYLRREQPPSPAALHRAIFFTVAIVLSATVTFVNRQYFGGGLTRTVEQMAEKRLREKLSRLVEADK